MALTSKSLNSNTRSGSANAASNQTDGDGADTVYLLGNQSPIWRAKDQHGLTVEVLDLCVIRWAETKKVGILYRHKDKYHVRAVAEFKRKFEPVPPEGDTLINVFAKEKQRKL